MERWKKFFNYCDYYSAKYTSTKILVRDQTYDINLFMLPNKESFVCYKLAVYCTMINKNVIKADIMFFALDFI